MRRRLVQKRASSGCVEIDGLAVDIGGFHGHPRALRASQVGHKVPIASRVINIVGTDRMASVEGDSGRSRRQSVQVETRCVNRAQECARTSTPLTHTRVWWHADASASVSLPPDLLDVGLSLTRTLAVRDRQPGVRAGCIWGRAVVADQPQPASFPLTTWRCHLERCEVQPSPVCRGCKSLLGVPEGSSGRCALYSDIVAGSSIVEASRTWRALSRGPSWQSSLRLGVCIGGAHRQRQVRGTGGLRRGVARHGRPGSPGDVLTEPLKWVASHRKPSDRL